MHVTNRWEKTKLSLKLQVLKDGTHFSPQSKVGPYKYITSKNIKYGKIDIKDVCYISEEEHKIIYKGSPVKYNDVLLTKDGANTGNAAINTLKEEFSLLSSVAFMRGKPDILLNEFLLHLILSPIGQSSIKSEMAGQAITRLTLNKIGDLKFLFPTFPEQQKIAQILSTWDKAIEKLEALIAAKQKRKKALMQLLLTGKRRFSGFEGEWKEITIRQIGKIVSGGTPDTNIEEYWGGDILWMTPTDVTALKNRFISDTARKITNKGQKNSSATIIPAGSLLVCTQATIGIMSISTTDIITNQGFKNLVPNKNFDVEFLYYLFSYSKDKFIRYACGSTFFELSKKDFEKLTFKCPGLNEQQKIASVLTSADTEIETHQKQLTALKQQKKGLMQQLLTGKKRVNV